MIEADTSLFNNPEPLHPDLAARLFDFNAMPGAKMIHHPLVISVPHYEPMNGYMNQFFAQKQKTVAAAVEAGDWEKYVALHERPYRVHAVADAVFKHELKTPSRVWGLVREAWIDSENIHEEWDNWLELWMSDVPRRHLVMTVDERQALKALPDHVRVYRGYTHPDAREGMSWTTDRDKAVWFSRRFAAERKGRAHLAEGVVPKRRVMAHFLSRGEHEIVVMPGDVDVEG